MQHNIRKMIISMVLMVSMAVLLAGFLPMSVFAGTGKTGTEEVNTEIKILNPPQKAMKKDEELTLNVKTNDNGEITWESSDPTVATVGETVVPDENNSKIVTTTVTAVGPGEVTIKAKTGDMEDSCKIIVSGFVGSVEVKSGGATKVDGTFYGSDGGQTVSGDIDSNGKVGDVDISSVIAIEEDGSVSIKDSVNFYGTVNVNNELKVNIKEGGELNIKKDATFNVTNKLDVNVENGGILNVKKGGMLNLSNTFNVNVKEGGTFSVGGPLTVDVKEGSSLDVNVGKNGILNFNVGDLLDIKVDGKLSVEIEGNLNVGVNVGAELDAKEDATFNVAGTISVDVKEGGKLDVQEGSPLNVSIKENGSVDVNVNKGGEVNFNIGDPVDIDVNENGKLSVLIEGTVNANINDGAELDLEGYPIVSVNNDGVLNLNSGTTTSNNDGEPNLSGGGGGNGIIYLCLGGTISSDKNMVFNVGGTLNLNFTLNASDILCILLLGDSSTLNVNDGGILNVNDSGIVLVDDGGIVNVNDGGTVNVNSGGILDIASILNVYGDGTVNVHNGGTLHVQYSTKVNGYDLNMLGSITDTIITSTTTTL